MDQDIRLGQKGDCTLLMNLEIKNNKDMDAVELFVYEQVSVTFDFEMISLERSHHSLQIIKRTYSLEGYISIINIIISRPEVFPHKPVRGTSKICGVVTHHAKYDFVY